MDAKKSYSTEAVAKVIGVSRQLLHKWMNAGHIAKPQSVDFGERSILLWTAADIERARKFKGTLKSGRPRKKE
jgi:predicted DNA-binding transcriptional regulator AlpA